MKKLFILMLMVVLLVGTVSAMDWDNVKHFDSKIGNYGKITIENWFGIGEKIIELELKNNSEICGSNCYAIKEIKLYQKTSLVDKVIFKTKQEDGSWDEQPIRSYQLYYLEKGLWEEFELEQEFEIGTYQVKLEGEKKPSRTIDWIIKTNGVWTDEWAVWGGLFNGTEYQLSVITSEINEAGLEINNVIVTELGNNVYKINTSNADDEVSRALIMKTLFYGTDGSNPRSTSQYINATEVYSNDQRDDGKRGHYSRLQTTNGNGAQTASWTGTFVDTSTNNNASSWSFVRARAALAFTAKAEWEIPEGTSRSFVQVTNSDATVDETGTDTSGDQTNNPADCQLTTRPDAEATGLANTKVVILASGNITWVYNDGGGTYATVTNLSTDFFNDENFPEFIFPEGQVTLSSPIDNYISPKEEIEFNCSASISGATLTNISLFTNESGSWEIKNTTIVTGTSNSTLINRTLSDVTLWTCQACDSDGDCGFASENRTLDVDTEDPQITLTAPPSVIEVFNEGDNHSLNWTVTDTNLDSCWYQYSLASNIFNSTISYYALDETSGAVIDEIDYANGTNNGATRGVTGIINNAFDFDGVNDQVNFGNPAGFNFDTNIDFSISGWIKTTESNSRFVLSKFDTLSANAEGFYIEIVSGKLRSLIQSNGTTNELLGTNITVNDDAWHHFAVSFDRDNLETFYIDGSLINSTDISGIGNVTNGSSLYFAFKDQLITDLFFNGTIDEVGIWNRTLNASEVSELYNSGSGIPYSSDVGMISVPVTCGDNTTIFQLESGRQNITFFANDTVGNIANVTTSWIYNFIQNSLTFNSSTFETSNEGFTLNLTPSDFISLTGILNYSGTETIADVTCNGTTYCIISDSIDIPLVSSGENENKSFNWIINLFNGTSSSVFTTSLEQQNVTRIHLEITNATFQTRTLNFTTYDEQDLSRVDPMLFDATFEFWLGEGTVKRNNSFMVNSSEVNLSLFPNLSISIDATINYDEGIGTDYTDRFFFFQDDLISNVVQDIFLYLLDSDDATSFILKVQDENLLPLENVLVESYRYYPGTDEFRLVQVANTNEAGKSVGFFEAETVEYKFIVRNGTDILLETEKGVLAPETSPFTLTFNIGDDLGEPWSSVEPIPNVNSTLTWENNITTYTYEDSSGLFTQARLWVQKVSLTNSSAYVTICNETSNIASAVLSCNLTSQDGGFFLAGGYITRTGEALDKQISFQIEDFSSTVGMFGLFAGFFLIVAAASIFVINVVAGLWAITIVIALVNVFGLIKFGAVFVTALFGVTIILTWLLER